MRKIAAIAVLWLTAGLATAHEDRILHIGPDGTIGEIPATYGPVKVEISHAPQDSRTVTKVRLSSPRFNVILSQCIVGKLKRVSHVQASGSWYHPQEILPPYASLTFHTDTYEPGGPNNNYYSVTFSLLDGRILMGARAWDPPVGSWRAQFINPADKCSHWRGLGMWPNNSFKPNPLRRFAELSRCSSSSHSRSARCGSA